MVPKGLVAVAFVTAGSTLASLAARRDSLYLQIADPEPQPPMLSVTAGPKITIIVR